MNMTSMMDDLFTFWEHGVMVWVLLEFRGWFDTLQSRSLVSLEKGQGGRCTYDTYDSGSR